MICIPAVFCLEKEQKISKLEPNNGDVRIYQPHFYRSQKLLV